MTGDGGMMHMVGIVVWDCRIIMWDCVGLLSGIVAGIEVGIVWDLGEVLMLK